MDIPNRYNGRPSPPLTFIGDDSTERRSSLTMPVQENKIIELYDPIDAVSCNKNQDKIVCAGSRGVLRVFQVTDQCLIPLVDLKKVAAKNKCKTPLLYSPSNVAWSKLRDDLIATTSTIGAVVLWNIEQMKIENHWKAHTRSATVVRFHRHNPNIMISGSKDSCMFVYDIREEKAIQELKRGIQETVRDLMFSMIEGDEYHFLSADDGGIVKVWDMRNPSLPQQARQLHQGYISCIQSHPNRPFEVATGGGRDKRVKIWNWKEDSRRYKQVETLAPVGRINWRPDNEYQLATCAVVHEVNVLLWDIRRPHMPMVSFPGHKDSATDVFWSRMEPHRFVSVGKDGLVILQNLADGDLAIDHLCDAQIDVAPDGLIVFALNADHEDKKKPRWEVNDVQLQLKKMRNSSDKRREAAARVLEQRRINNQLINLYEPFSHNVKSDVTLGIPSSVQYSLQSRLFEAYAKNYILGGQSIADMCEHNAMVSRYQLDETRERLWRYVGGLLAEARFQEFYDKEEEEQKIVEDKKWNIYIKEHVNQGKVPLLPPETKPEVPFAFLVSRSRKAARQLYDPKRIDNSDINVFEFLTELSSDCEKYGELSLDGLKGETPNGDEFCGLPEEAFGMKRYFQDVSQAPITEPNSWKSSEGRKKYRAEEILAQQLHYLAHQGDMQMCATVATIAGRRLADTLSDYFIEAWVQSYMDMLYRLQLYETIAALRKYTCAERIRQEGGDGTTFRPHIWHTRQNEAWGDSIRMGFKKTSPAYALCKGKLKNGNCDKCNDPIVPICSLCDGPIEGLTWNCMKCSHSMHIDHAFVWFRERVQIVGDDKSGDGGEMTTEKMRRRRMRLAMGANRAVQDHTETRCPVPNCKCDCLQEEEQDELEAEKPIPVHSVEWMKRQLIYDKYRRPARFDRKPKECKKGKNKKKKPSLLDKIEIRAANPEYDFIPEKESFYQELVKGAKTDEETQLCAMIKMIMALPEEYKPQIKQKLEEPTQKVEDKEEDKKKSPYGVLLGLTSKEKMKEPKIRRRTSRSRSRVSESQKADRKKKLCEYNQKRQMARWKDVLMDDETSDEDEPVIITGEKEKLFGGRNCRPKFFDILRCIFWGMLRRIKKVQRRRRRVHQKKRKIRQKAMYSVVKRLRRKNRRKSQTIRKFLELIDRKKRNKAGEKARFVEELNKANATATTMVHFVGLRLKPKFMRKYRRLMFANPSRTRRRRNSHHIAKILVIRQFAMGKKRRRKGSSRKTFPIRGIEPEDLVPNTFEEVKARKITTARNTMASHSGPATPGLTDYQI